MAGSRNRWVVSGQGGGRNGQQSHSQVIPVQASYKTLKALIVGWSPKMASSRRPSVVRSPARCRFTIAGGVSYADTRQLRGWVDESGQSRDVRCRSLGRMLDALASSTGRISRW